MISYLIGFFALFFFVLPLLLTIKWRPLIKICGGIASFYRFHHYVGLFCVIPIFLHIASQFYELSFNDWYLFLDLSDLGLLTAWLGLWLIIIALIGAYLKKLSYRIWRMIHLLFILAYFLIFFHVWLFLPDHAFFFISILIIMLCGILLLLILLFSYFSPLHKMNFEVTKLNTLGSDIFELSLQNEIVKKKILYPAGQIVYIRFDSPPFSRSWHPFSIASCQTDLQLKLLIKGFGHDTKLIESIKIGSKVSVVGPFFEFNVSSNKNQIWIAGGIGIAPFIGRIRCFSVKRYSNVKLIYYSNSVEEIKCQNELREAEKIFPNFSWHSIIAPRGNLMNQTSLKKLIDLDLKTEFLICGPQGFMKNIRLYLGEIGIDKKCIHTEEYTEW